MSSQAASAIVLVLIASVVCAIVVAGVLLVIKLNKKESSPGGTPGTPGAPNQQGAVATSTASADIKEVESHLSTNVDNYLAITSTGGSWTLSEFEWWTAGFMTGCWWKMFSLTKNDAWKKLAQQGTSKLTAWQNRNNTHDIGFVMMCSFGYESQKNAAVLKTAAKNLASRYVTSLKLIRSWGSTSDSDVKVIIDNMMNLKLLFEAAKLPGGDSRWKEVATNHALESAKQFVRDNGSTFHLITFTRGKAKKGTHQGAADNSTWARGQAWAIYGFTDAFTYTQNSKLKDTAMKCAKYFMDNLPTDNVPLWDFQAPGNKKHKDTSAAAIAACGLFKLGKATGNATYTQKAKAITESLRTNYAGASKNLASLLCCACVNVPKGDGVGVGYIVADYYYLEALELMRA